MTPSEEQLEVAADIVIGWIENRIACAMEEPTGLAIDGVFGEQIEQLGLGEDELDELTSELDDSIWVAVGRKLIAEHSA